MADAPFEFPQHGDRCRKIGKRIRNLGFVFGHWEQDDRSLANFLHDFAQTAKPAGVPVVLKILRKTSSVEISSASAS